MKYSLSEKEKKDKRININNVNIKIKKTYILNDNITKIHTFKKEKFIDWMNIIMECCNFEDWTTPSKFMYCIYLYAIENCDSRKELVQIFANEKLKSEYFLVNCDFLFEEEHYINDNGLCICNS